MKRRISKRQFYKAGAFANRRLFRLNRYGYWEYYESLE